jgi:phosphoglycerol transferase
MDSSYQRTCFNLIINPHPAVANVGNDIVYNRTWALFDMFPTMLASIGVQIEGNKLGLGTNLFSGEKTLFEREGVATVNAELVNRSDFYNNNILVDPDKYKK